MGISPEALLRLAEDLDEGATIMHADCRSGDQSDRYHATLDGVARMRRVAGSLRRIAAPTGGRQ